MQGGTTAGITTVPGAELLLTGFIFLMGCSRGHRYIYYKNACIDTYLLRIYLVTHVFASKTTSLKYYKNGKALKPRPQTLGECQREVLVVCILNDIPLCMWNDIIFNYMTPY